MVATRGAAKVEAGENADAAVNARAKMVAVNFIFIRIEVGVKRD